MSMPLSRSAVVFFIAFIGLVHGRASADPATDGPQPVVTDANGKEIILKKWKIVGGVRTLGWLPKAIDAFEMREFGSTTFKDGVLTLVPLSRIEAIHYEYDKETARVQLAGVDKPLQGTTPGRRRIVDRG